MRRLIKKLKRWNRNKDIQLEKWQRNAIFETVIEYSIDIKKYKRRKL